MLRRAMARTRSLIDGIRKRGELNSEIDAEFRAHLEMRADDRVRSGMSRGDAIRQARLEFGSTSHYHVQATDARGLRPFDALRFSWLDVRLGARMLRKYPGVTIVGGIAIAFAVAVGATTFELMSQYLHPKLPIPAAERFAVIELWDPVSGRAERRMDDAFLRWRRDATSLVELTGVRPISRNLIADDGAVGEPIAGVEMSAAGFNLAGTPAMLGRTLTAADEMPGAANVVVLGFELWQQRFQADSHVVGRTIRLGADRATVVGVMPRGFAFPDYRELWVPLRLSVSDTASGSSATYKWVLGRLAEGATLQSAEAELSVLMPPDSRREAATAATIRPRVRSFADATSDAGSDGTLFLVSGNLFLTVLLALVFGNVALLILARAATRESEIIVRNALGATRGRIVMQLFAETLVLGAAAAGVGLVVAAAGWRWALTLIRQSADGHLGYWVHADLSPSTYVYALALVVICAIVAGALPALKLTRGIESQLRRAAAGASGLRFTGVWTVVIVAQIAVTIAFPVTVFFAWRDARQIENARIGVRANEYIISSLSTDDGKPIRSPRDVERRLEAEQGITAVTYATLLPGMDHPQRAIEVEGAAPLDSTAPLRVSSVSVAPDYFETMDASPLMGRVFHPDDVSSAARPLVVNEAFVREVLHGQNPIGRRIRFVVDESGDEDRGPDERIGPWRVIVGVVKDLGMSDGSNPRESGAGIYQPLNIDRASVAFVAIRGSGDASTMATVRRAAATVDPHLRFNRLMRLGDVQALNLATAYFWVRLLSGVAMVAIILSLASIYSVMSFAVSRRTREIGVRVALGAMPRQIVATIFATPLRQLRSGLIVGALLVTALARAIFESLTGGELLMIVGYSTIMLAICLLACIAPVRRALRVDPTEALRTD